MRRPSSSLPRKQRKFLYVAPLHLRQRLMGAHLSPQLRKSIGRRALAVRKGDTVKVMRGKNRGFSGKVVEVDLKQYKVYIEGLKRRKSDGTEVKVALIPSNLMITEADMSDKQRKTIAERKRAAPAAPKKV